MQKQKIFISYTADDINFAALAKVKLEAEGFEVWLDKTNLLVNKEWQEGIELAISQCWLVNSKNYLHWLFGDKTPNHMRN